MKKKLVSYNTSATVEYVKLTSTSFLCVVIVPGLAAVTLASGYARLTSTVSSMIIALCTIRCYSTIARSAAKSRIKSVMVRFAAVALFTNHIVLAVASADVIIANIGSQLITNTTCKCKLTVSLYVQRLTEPNLSFTLAILQLNGITIKAWSTEITCRSESIVQAL